MKNKSKKPTPEWKYTAFKDELPKVGTDQNFLAIDDNSPGVCFPRSVITSAEWLVKNYEKDGWTHWMIVPERPMRTTDKLLWSEIALKHRVKLPSGHKYNPSLFVCQECERAQEHTTSSLFMTEQELSECPFKCQVVGFAKLQDDVMFVSECVKCSERYYSHAYTKESYQKFLNGEMKI
jgi:hypothetical protein